MLLLVVMLSIMTVETFVWYAFAQNTHFQLISYSYKSLAGTDSVYPGSRNVELTVTVQYVSEDEIYISFACLERLPIEVKVSRGASPCSPPYSPSDIVTNIVEQNDIIIFRYRLDVESSATPGNYYVGIAIHYRRITDTLTPGVEYVEIYLPVKQHPEIEIDVIDWYWSPGAYPGSHNVYLYIVLRNIGEAMVLQADGTANLQHDVFTPNSVRFTVSGLYRYATISVPLGPISIDPRAAPNVQYPVELVLHATMRTEDGVVYTTSTRKLFSITISLPPSLNLEIIDYGFESLRVVENTVHTRFYVLMLNRDFKTIRSIVAYYSILTPEASFINGSKKAISVYDQLLSYGDTATLYSIPLIIGAVDRVGIELKLVIYGDDNGAEFWYEKKYSFAVSIAEPHTNIFVADVYWVDREVYPGSENAALAVVLENYDVLDVQDLIATLELPENFYPKTIKLSGIRIARGGRGTLVFSGISIGGNVNPGVYRVKLEISGISVTNINTFYRIQNSYTLLIEVSKPPKHTIADVINYGWVSGRAYINSISTGLYAYFMVVEPGYTIQNPVFTVHLPKQMAFQSLNRSLTVIVNGVFGYGQAIRVEVPNIDVAAHDEGLYPIIVRLKALVTGSQSFWYDKTYTLLMPLYSPRLNVTLIDKGWRYGISSPRMSGASVYLTLLSHNIDTLNTVIIQLEFDVAGARFIDGENRSVSIITGPINYGNTFTATFTDIEVDDVDGKIIARVMITGIVHSNGMHYTATSIYTIELNLLSELKTFIISSIHTMYGNRYAPILPSARGVLVNVDIINSKTYSIAWVRPKTLTTPPIVKINDVSGTCLYGVAAAGTCTLTLNIDVDLSAQPGSYSITMEIEYGVRSGGSITVYSDVLEIPVIIASYEYYKSILRVVSWYWGVQAPMRVLEGQRNVPLTLTIINSGPYSVSGVEVELESVNEGVFLISRGAVCAQILNVGGSCLATFYVDLSNVSTSTVGFYANIKYIFTLYGANINAQVGYHINLKIDRSASGRGLEVLEWGWINGWPTYPNTDNATYYVSIVNRWPYRVSGVKLVLSLPSGFSSKGESNAVSYISGPIASLQQFTATFQISVGGVKPGRYSATLSVEYVVETGTPDTAITENHLISILVNDPSTSIDTVLVQWIGASPEPGTYGAILAVVLRNNYNPSIKGVVLELNLPKGFTFSATNQSYARVHATSTDLIEYLRISPNSYQQITNYISQIIQQTVERQSFEYGSLLYFYIKLNVLVDRPGTYRVPALLNFIDHWNCIRRIPLEISVMVLGSTKIISVDAPTRVRVADGTSLLNIGVRNHGSAPLYNVYVYLVPYTSILLPSYNIRYIDVLPPNSIVNVSYMLIYNPVALAMGVSQTYVRYASVPFGVAVVYRDISGNIQYLNTSLSVILEPFIDLRLENLKATISGGVLKVSGVVVNYGIATARSVEARVKLDGILAGTLIGDIDPASQSVFRIEARVEEVVDSITLYIIYRDEYYTENVLERKVGILVEVPTTTYTPQQTQTLRLTDVLVIVAVSVFLLTTALILYRHTRRIASP